MARLIIGLALVATFALVPGVAFAQESPFSSCPQSDASAVRSLGVISDPVPDRPTAIRTRLSGKVVLPCGTMTLYADEVIIFKDHEAFAPQGSLA